MSKFFGYVNEVDLNKKLRQFYLELGKFWVNQCGCMHYVQQFIWEWVLLITLNYFNIGLRDITMKNILILENYWNNLLLISSIISPQLIPVLRQRTYPLLWGRYWRDILCLLGTSFLKICFLFHKGQNYFGHNSQQFSVISIYVGGFYHWISACCQKRRS